jgi:hypothetical protein
LTAEVNLGKIDRRGQLREDRPQRSQMGAAEAQMGAAEAQMGAAEAQMGAAEAQMGAAEAQMGAAEAQMGAAEAQMGATEAHADGPGAVILDRCPPEPTMRPATRYRNLNSRPICHSEAVIYQRQSIAEALKFVVSNHVRTARFQ